jgi:hypothetical protein
MTIWESNMKIGLLGLPDHLRLDVTGVPWQMTVSVCLTGTLTFRDGREARRVRYEGRRSGFAR